MKLELDRICERVKDVWKGRPKNQSKCNFVEILIANSVPHQHVDLEKNLCDFQKFYIVLQ